MTNATRTEHDSMGPVHVPEQALWGAQTQRSLQNFAIAEDRIPTPLIHALARIKQAAAIVNARHGLISNDQRDLIVEAAAAIAEGHHDDQFPLRVWQTGSGTQTNMNLNEVISNLASRQAGEALGSHRPIHPNDHVNRSQSTNDAFPAAIHVAAAEAISRRLQPELHQLREAFAAKAEAWSPIVKIGRTHLQDAVPLTLGQEASAWREQIGTAAQRIDTSLEEILPLPLGGTAVGTGLNAPRGFSVEAAAELKRLTGLPFTTAPNKFAVMASHDGLVNTMGQLRLLAVSLLKIANDIRLLACGPRAGLAELHLPENEPGSSIMPGKVNPTQAEALTMVCAHVMGNDAAVGMAGSQGHFELNVYNPMMAYNLLQSIQLLGDAADSFTERMLLGIQANEPRIEKLMKESLMLVTALAPTIGYDNATKVAKTAHKNGTTLKEEAIALGFVDEETFDRVVRPEQMIGPKD